MKLLILGNHTCGNRGDSAILRGLLDAINILNPHAEVDVMSRYPVSSSWLLNRPVMGDPLFLQMKQHNSAAGVVGSLIENRADFEKRRYNSVAANAHGSAAALQGAVYQVENVLDCLVLENKTDATVTKQGVSLISHSVAVCVYGGENESGLEAVQALHDAGHKVNVWTVDDLESANRMIEYGVDYITTNIIE